MAVHHITFGRAMQGSAPVVAASPAAVETLTANGTTTVTASGVPGEVCTIATDTACYVAFGTTPTAAADAGHYLPANSVRDFGFLQAGWKVAVTAVV